MTVNVFDGNYTDGESKRIYSRKTVISFSPNGSGKGTNAGGGGTPVTKVVNVTVLWVNNKGKTISWPSTVQNIDVTLNGANLNKTLTATAAHPKIGFGNITASGGLTLSANPLKVANFTGKISGSAENGYIVTYKQDKLDKVKLIPGPAFKDLIKNDCTGVIFGKASQYESYVSGRSYTAVAVDGNATGDSTRKEDYKLYKVGKTAYVLSEDGTFIANEDCSGMFSGCTNLTSITWPTETDGFDTSRTTTMESMFMNCSKMTQFVLPAKFVRGNCTTLLSMFDGCTHVTYIRIEDWDTSNVTTMMKMFQNFANHCDASEQVTVDLSSFEFDKCVDLSKLFYNSYKVNNAPVSQIYKITMPESRNYPVCKTMDAMFSSLTNLEYLENFDAVRADSVTTIKSLFYADDKLAINNDGVIDISGYVMPACTSIESTFSYLPSMTTLKINSVNMKVCSVTKNVFEKSSNIKNIEIKNSDFSGLTALSWLNVAEKLYLSDSIFGVSGLENTFSSGKSSKVKYIDLTSAKFPNCTTANKMFAGSPIETAILKEIEAPKLAICTYMFQNCTELTRYTFSDVTLEACTTIAYMFSGCTNLEEVYMSGLTTPSLTNCSYMFQNCSNLDIGAGNFAGWDTSSVTNMSYIFSNCKKMGYSSNGVVRLGNMNLSSCTSMQNAFDGCTSMKTLKLDKIDFEKCNNFKNLYINCPEFTSIEITNSNLIGITNLSFLFGAKNIDLSGSTLGFAELKSTFANQNIESFILNGTHFPNCTSFFQFFSGCQKLTKVEMIGLDVPVLNNCSSMFLNCHALRTLDMSGCDTSSVTNMSYMFSGCSVLSFDSSGWDKWDTSNVTNMSYMFKDCCYDYQKSNDPALRTAEYTINISNFSFKSVTDMKYMLSCGTIKNEDYKYDILDKIIMPDGTNDNGNALEVTNIMYMFMWRNNTTEIRNLEHFKTSGKLKYARSMFSYVNCTVLDIRGLNFENLDNSDDGSSWIFDNCKSLVTVYADPNKNYIPSKGQGFFNSCDNIKGGAGTTFISNEKKYAKIDGGTGNEGYFTDYHVRTA